MSRHPTRRDTLIGLAAGAGLLAAGDTLAQAAYKEAPVLAELEKWVAVEFLEPASPGWAKVRHRDGATGYIRATQVWGL